MAPSPLSVSSTNPSPPSSRRVRRTAVAAAGAALATLLLLAAAAAVWRPAYLPAALLRRPPLAAARFYSFDLVREYPHDPAAFTQVPTLRSVPSRSGSLPDRFLRSRGLFLAGPPVRGKRHSLRVHWPLPPVVGPEG
uniref:Uncharacterized protein n=1 Tax=Triticum urartu TaxID=4572 RepID=A0A8R7UYK8_TRIUA